MENKFYLSVLDIESQFGYIDKMVNDDNSRYYSKAFLADPKKSLLYLGLENSNDYFNEKKVAEFIENVEYDEEGKVYIWSEYRTTHFNTPTECHMEKFKNGEYQLFKLTYELQVLETTLVDKNLLK